MSRSAGPGYPIFFKCAKAAQIVRHNLMEEKWLRDQHVVTLTGRTKPTPRNGKGHPRKSWTSRDYRCSCGHVGWSSHTDLERMEARDA